MNARPQIIGIHSAYTLGRSGRRHESDLRTPGLFRGDPLAANTDKNYNAIRSPQWIANHFRWLPPQAFARWVCSRSQGALVEWGSACFAVPTSTIGCSVGLLLGRIRGPAK